MIEITNIFNEFPATDFVERKSNYLTSHKINL